MLISFLFFNFNLSGYTQEKSIISANKKFVREYVEALSGKEKPVEILKKYIADSDKALIDHILNTESSFPNYEMIIEDLLGENDMVALRAVFKGSNEGPIGDAPATNKKVEMPFIIIYQVRDNKIINHWMASDNLSLFKQLGII